MACPSGAEPPASPRRLPRLRPQRQGRQGPVRPTPTLRAPRPSLARPPRLRRRRLRRFRSPPRRRRASAPAPANGSLRRGLGPPSPPLSSQAVILYKKGDVAGLAALAASATDPAERSALEWASLRADPHPSFALARRLPRGSSGLAEPRLDSRAAGSRPRRASAGAGEDRRIFRRRPAAIERRQDRRGARRAGDGPRRGGVANHPRAMARRQFRRLDRERRSCANSARRSPRPTTPIGLTACSTRATSAPAHAPRRLPAPTSWRSHRLASGRLARP